MRRLTGRITRRGWVVQDEYLDHDDAGIYFPRMPDGSERKNSYDGLRLLAAALVMVSHGWALLGMMEYDFVWCWTKGSFSASWLGLAIFFSLSGFLIDQSSRNSENWQSFFRRRFLRLWPGLAAVVLITVFVVGPLISQDGAIQYFSAFQSWFYLSCLTIWGMRWKLPGVFNQNPLPEVNGSLWTLPYEVTFYFLSWKIRNRDGAWRLYLPFFLLAVGLAARGFVYEEIKGIKFRPFLMGLNHLLDFGLFYVAGTCIRRLWRFRSELRWIALGLFFCWLGCIEYAGIRKVLDFLVLPLGVILVGAIPIFPFDRAANRGDFSYGLYIWGFLVQQLLVHAFGAHHFSPMGLALAGICCSLPLAFLSWHLIEKRALARKNRKIDFWLFKL